MTEKETGNAQPGACVDVLPRCSKYVTKRGRLQIGRHVGFQNRRTKWRHEAAKKEKKQKEQTSTETMNNCVQKEEVKNEKEKEHGCDESVLKKAENSP